MKALDVHVAASMQRAFRRRAIRHFLKTKEYAEGMKIRRSVGEFHVEAYVKIKIEEADDTGVTFDRDDFERFKKECQDEGYEFGTIHTHIISDTAPSAFDLVGASEEGEILIGVMEIDRRKLADVDKAAGKKGRIYSKIDYWIPQIPCNVNTLKE